MKKKLLMVFLLMTILFLVGCDSDKEKQKKAVEFTVCDESKMPNELLEIVNEKKEKIFKLSYINDNYLYIAVGYGEKNRQDYSVIVEDLYVTDNAVYVDTELYTAENTPTDAVAEGGASMYPYIVIKCEKIDLPVVFDTD